MENIHTISPKFKRADRVITMMDKAIAFRIVPGDDPNAVDLYLVDRNETLNSETISVWVGVCCKLYLRWKGVRELSYGELSNIAVRKRPDERWWI